MTVLGLVCGGGTTMEADGIMLTFFCPGPKSSGHFQWLQLVVYRVVIFRVFTCFVFLGDCVCQHIFLFTEIGAAHRSFFWGVGCVHSSCIEASVISHPSLSAQILKRTNATLCSFLYSDLILPTSLENGRVASQWWGLLLWLCQDSLYHASISPVLEPSIQVTHLPP